MWNVPFSGSRREAKRPADAKPILFEQEIAEGAEDGCRRDEACQMSTWRRMGHDSTEPVEVRSGTDGSRARAQRLRANRGNYLVMLP